MHVFSGNVYAEPTPVIAEPVTTPIAVEPVVVTTVAEPQATTETFEATAYVAMCDTGCSGITATGYDVRNTIYYGDYRILAAGKGVPFYSLMKVTTSSGHTFTGIVLDRGSAISDKNLDILMNTTGEAFEFGRQSIKVEVIRWGK